MLAVHISGCNLMHILVSEFSYCNYVFSVADLMHRSFDI